MRVFDQVQGGNCNEVVDVARVEEIINKLNRVLGLFVGTKRMNCFGKNRERTTCECSTQLCRPSTKMKLNVGLL